jgi:hydrogenase expression/formation protein HypD
MNELRSKQAIQSLLKTISGKTRSLSTPISIMEVCGTHTMTIHRYGLKKLLDGAGIRMLSGPGCPVCITPNEIHEAAIGLVTEKKNLLLATFGDMTRVPTRKNSLQTTVPAPGSQIKIVYSPQEALDLARSNPDKDVVFFGVGFETTIPSILLSVDRASKEDLFNYSVLTALWIIPPPLKAILDDKETLIQGFLYPGHVSAIIGVAPYAFIPEEYGIPGAITGFEPVDILLAIQSILDQIGSGKPEVTNEYARVVRPTGNPAALALMDKMCTKEDVHWRGIGAIPKSGLKLVAEYERFDAEKKYGLKIVGGSGDLPGCLCGDVLRGKILPPDCPLFGNKCHPESPVGPCMVSFEGACLAYFKYALRHKASGKRKGE